MRFLKQNTDQYISVGPFLDKTAGLGNEDALTVTSFSGVIVKSTHASASTHTDFTPSATAANDWGMAAIGHGGFYDLKVPDSEINFVGSAKIGIWYDAEALPSWEEFMVVPANVWDALMGTDFLDVNMAQYLGTAAHAASEAGTPCVEVVRWGGNDVPATGVNGVPKVDLQDIAGHSVVGSGTQVADAFETMFNVATPVLTVANVNQTGDSFAIVNGDHGLVSVQDDVDEILTRIPDATAGATGGLTIERVVVTGAVATDAGNSATQIKTNLSSAVDNFYSDCLIILTSGALAGQVKKVTDYDGTNKILTFGAFTGTPADGVTFKLINQ